MKWDSTSTTCKIQIRKVRKYDSERTGFLHSLTTQASVEGSICQHGSFIAKLGHFCLVQPGKLNPAPCRRHPFYARLISNSRVTAADHWQDVRLVQFDIKGSGMRYILLQFIDWIITYLRTLILSTKKKKQRFW